MNFFFKFNRSEYFHEWLNSKCSSGPDIRHVSLPKSAIWQSDRSFGLVAFIELSMILLLNSFPSIFLVIMA